MRNKVVEKSTQLHMILSFVQPRCELHVLKSTQIHRQIEIRNGNQSLISHKPGSQIVVKSTQRHVVFELGQPDFVQNVDDVGVTQIVVELG